jgi:hypothetical protein
MKKYFFVLAFFNFLMAGCWKTNVNPDHVNKFTCKVNGVFWEALPNERDILGNDLQMGKSAFSDFASIFANNTKKNQTIGFNMSLSDTVKVFNITNMNPYGDYAKGCAGYKLDTLTKHTVIITEIDKIQKIAKGTFTFRAINSNSSCVDTVSITEGFFDMQYSIN